MDCQGTGDIQRSDSRMDNLILFLGLTLADVQILNVKSVLTVSELERLEVR